jgi:hypothetical protein
VAGTWVWDVIVSGYLKAYAHRNRSAARRRAGREAAQAGVLRGADAVLHPGVRAVAGIEVGKSSGVSVGREGGVAPAVTLFERVQLGAGMRCARGARSPWSRSGRCEQPRPGVRHLHPPR